MRNQVVPVFGLLQSAECHLCAGDVFLGVLEVFEECILLPGNALGFVCVGVREALYLTGLSAEESVEVGSDFVTLFGYEVVTLGATGLGEESVAMKDGGREESW